jgi:hypothetical protein
MISFKVRLSSILQVSICNMFSIFKSAIITEGINFTLKQLANAEEVTGKQLWTKTMYS